MRRTQTILGRSLVSSISSPGVFRSDRYGLKFSRSVTSGYDYAPAISDLSQPVLSNLRPLF